MLPGMGTDSVALFNCRRSILPSVEKRQCVASGRDFTALFIPVRFDEVVGAPDRTSRWVASEFPSAVQAHSDPRGVLVYPDSAAPTQTGYRKAVEELGSVGTWLPVTATPGSSDHRYKLTVPRDAEGLSTSQTPRQGSGNTQELQVTFGTQLSLEELVEFYGDQLRSLGMRVTTENGKFPSGSQYAVLEGAAADGDAVIAIEARDQGATVSIISGGAVYVDTGP